MKIQNNCCMSNIDVNFSETGTTMIISFTFFLLWVGRTQADLIRPGYGAVFNQIGMVAANLDRHYLAVEVEIPSPIAMLNPFKSLGCKRESKDDPGVSIPDLICDDYAPLFREYKRTILEYELRVESILAEIHQMVPEREHRDREKRGVMAVLGVIGTISSLVNTYIMRRRNAAMEKTVSELKRRNFDFADKYIEIQSDLATAAKVTAEGFRAIEQRLTLSNSKLSRLAEEMRSYFAANNKSLDALERKLLMLTVSSRLASKAQILISRTSRQFEEVIHELVEFRNGMIKLLQNRLPSELVSSKELNELLTHVKELLYTSLPHYEILFPSLADFYRKTDITHDVVEGHVIMLIPIQLNRRNSVPLYLFHVESTYIPYVIGEDGQDGGQSYTKVMISKPYLATRDNHYFELTNSEFSQCARYGDMFLCEFLLIQTYQSEMTCNMAIYMGLDEAITQKCVIEYFHKITVVPTFLEPDEEILLANLVTPWSIKCEDRNVPMRHKGANYAIVNRASLCGCSINGNNFFIPQRLCKKDLDFLKILFPINIAVVKTFADEITDVSELTNLSSLFPEPLMVEVPHLTMELDNDPDVLHQREFSAPSKLDRLAAVLKDKQKVFLDRDSKIKHMSRFESWFEDLDSWAMGFTFILALMGLIAMILTIVQCCRQHRLGALLAGLLSSLPKAEAMPMLCQKDADAKDAIPAMMFHVATALVFYCIVKGAYYIYRKSTWVKVIAPSMIKHDGSSSHLLAEITNGYKTERVYICTLPTSAMNITITGKAKTEDLSVTWEKINGILQINWKQTNFKMSVGDKFIHPPCFAYLSWFQYRKLKTLLPQSHSVRFYITWDGITYSLGDQHFIKLASA
jgi:hypothetical protein